MFGLMRLRFGVYLAVFFPVVASAQQITPRQIYDRLVVASQTLNFSDVSPYIHTRSLKAYRSATSAVLKHAAEKYGADALVEFFQGATLQDLEGLSDQEYWAFLMASSLQFTTEKPTKADAPVAEFMEGAQVGLLYPGSGRCGAAPEAGLFSTRVVYCFEQEEGVWKMISFLPNKFERSLSEFLQKR